MTLTHFGKASERAKCTGKPHIWWDGTHWNAVRPDGYSGHLAVTPSKALEYANNGPEFFRKLEEFDAERREAQRRREARVWLAGDPEAPPPNSYLRC